VLVEPREQVIYVVVKQVCKFGVVGHGQPRYTGGE
jgi:hypothetical protein